MGMFLCNTTGIGGLGWGDLTLASFLPLKHYDVARLCSGVFGPDNGGATLMGALHSPPWLLSLGGGWYLDVLMLIAELAIVALLVVPIIFNRKKAGVSR